MTLKLEADFLLDNHHLPGEGVATPGLFLPQEKKTRQHHTPGFSPPHSSLFFRRGRKSHLERAFYGWSSTGGNKSIHTPAHVRCGVCFFRLQLPSAELSTDQLANAFCFSICSLFCLISQLVQKPSQEKAGLFLGFLKDPQLTTHTKHLAEYLDAQSIFIE